MINQTRQGGGGGGTALARNKRSNEFRRCNFVTSFRLVLPKVAALKSQNETINVTQLSKRALIRREILANTKVVSRVKRLIICKKIT